MHSKFLRLALSSIDVVYEQFSGPSEKLVEQFAMLPGVGSKSAQRMAFYILSMPDEQAKAFANAIVEAKKKVHRCSICQNLTDLEMCSICTGSKREKSIICVVSDPKDVLAIERSREYNGLYHVLHGASNESWGPMT